MVSFHTIRRGMVKCTWYYKILPTFTVVRFFGRLFDWFTWFYLLGAIIEGYQIDRIFQGFWHFSWGLISAICWTRRNRKNDGQHEKWEIVRKKSVFWPAGWFLNRFRVKIIGFCDSFWQPLVASTHTEISALWVRNPFDRFTNRSKSNSYVIWNHVHQNRTAETQKNWSLITLCE